ncbi:DegT/DnrJ/EryC1/StrS family aminotransferase [Thermodesulfobacteriota bacterium]
MAKLALYGGNPVRSKSSFLIFGSPSIEEPEIEEVVECLRSRWIGTGPKVHEFENNFSKYKGAKHAIALSSCTAALHLSMLAANIGPGDEVITSAMTFCATVNAIIHCGATPVLADCDRRTMNIMPEDIERKITPNTKAIIPVHFAGRSCDMDRIMAIAQEKNLLIIEDCAHAIETQFHGVKTGRFGKIGCFSFYVTKNIITGEGGMIITDDDIIAERTKILGLHGMNKDAWKRFSDDGYKHYEVVDAGYKYNMTDMQAAIGIHQLRRIKTYWDRRKKIWEKYNDAFSDLPCITPYGPEAESVHAYHLYTPLIEIEKINKNRDWVLNALTAENIGVGVHYLPLNIHPFYRKKFGLKDGDFPNAEYIGQRTLSLPLSAALEENDIDDVICAFRKVLSNC